MAVDLANDSTFTKVLEDNNQVVVKYYASWCGSCRVFEPKFKRLSEEDRFQNIKFLDVNAEESPEARKLAGVKNLPFFAIFKGGAFIEGIPTSDEKNVVDLILRLQA